MDIPGGIKRQFDNWMKPALSQLEECQDEGIIIAYAKGSDSESDTMEPMESMSDMMSNLDQIWGGDEFTTLEFHPR